MKTLAIWLYAISFLASVVLGGLDGIMYCFPVLALLVTAFMGVTILFLAVATYVRSARHTPIDEHQKWIL